MNASIDASAKGMQHGYLAGAYTKLTVGKLLSFGASAASKSAGYTANFVKGTVKGFQKTK